MPHGLEYVVRPFQSPGSLGNIVIPGTPERTQDKAHITWGGVGTMPSVKTVNPDSRVDICKEGLTEGDRDSEKIRIYGNDPENWVDVARAKTVRLKKQSETTDQSLNTWQGFTVKKFDERIEDNPNLKPQNDPGSNAFPSFKGTCLVTWNMKNE